MYWTGLANLPNQRFSKAMRYIQDVAALRYVALRLSRLVIIFATFMTFSSAQAQSAEDVPYSMVESIDSQLVRDDFETIEAVKARLEVDKARLELELAQKGGCPTVNGFVSGGYRDDTFRFSNASDIDIFGRFGSFGVSLEQPLFDGFKTKNSVKKADAKMRSSTAGLKQTRQQSRLDLINALIAVKLAEGQLQLRKEGYLALSKQLDHLVEKKSRGLATNTEIANVTSARGLISASVETAHRDLSIAVLEWQALGGRPDVKTLSLPRLEPLPTSLNVVLEEALRNNPEIIRLKSLEQAAKFETSIQKSNSYPTVNLAGQVMASESPVSFGDFSDEQSALSGVISVNVRVPIYQGGQNSKAREIANVEEQSAKLNLDLAIRNITREIVSNWTGLQAFERLRSVNAEATRASRKSANGYVRGLNAGVSTIQEVVQASLALIASQERELASRLENDKHRYALLGLMGRISDTSSVDNMAVVEASGFVPVACLRSR